MPAQRSVLKPFEWYRVTYAITNPNGKDYARIDFFTGGTKVGQILFGSAIAPGSFAALNGEEIDLYFPLSHFESIYQLLRQEKNLSLYVNLDPAAKPEIGGITNAAQRA
jgi:hypothetical protein